MITAEEARKLWSYDPVLGELRWKISPHVRIAEGALAGGISCYGYRVLTFKGKKYLASRIIWLMMSGAHPENEIDHENCKQADDRWDNLRPADRTQQLYNTRVRSDNVLGVKGVSPTKWGYSAFICSRGKRKNLGSFQSMTEAKAAYDSAALELYGEFARSA